MARCYWEWAIRSLVMFVACSALAFAEQSASHTPTATKFTVAAQARPWFQAVYVWRLGQAVASLDNSAPHLWFVFHGDIPKYYRSETERDRSALHARLARAGQSALLVFPIGTKHSWGNAKTSADFHRLATAFFALFKAIDQRYAKPDWRIQTFSFSGAGRVDIALHRQMLAADARSTRFLNRLKAMHSGDAMVSKAMLNATEIPDSWVEFLSAYPDIEASFVHDESAQYPYMFDLMLRIGRAFAPHFELERGESRTIANGRIRFWGGPTHLKAWLGQFERAFFAAP